MPTLSCQITVGVRSWSWSIL